MPLAKKAITVENANGKLVCVNKIIKWVPRGAERRFGSAVTLL